MISLRSVAVSVALSISSFGSTFSSSQVIGWVSDQTGIRNALFLVPLGYFAAIGVWLVLALHQRRIAGARDPAPLQGALETA